MLIQVTQADIDAVLAPKPVVKTPSQKLNDMLQTYGLTVDDLKATQAKVYSAQDALSMGLINKIQTRSEFVSYVLSKQGTAE